jgi:hypothetical protein
VNLLTEWNGLLYVAGNFTQVGGQNRQGLAQLDAYFGTVYNWNPAPNGTVMALTGDPSNPHNGWLFAGGSFTGIGASSPVLTNLALLDPNVGVANALDQADLPVHAIATFGSHAFVGGEFATVGGISRPYLAQIDSVGNPTGWQLFFPPNGQVDALAVAGNNLYVAGPFTRIAGDIHLGLAALDAVSERDLNWQVDVGDNAVTSIAPSGSRVFTGGSFSGIAQWPQRSFACVYQNSTVGVPKGRPAATLAFRAAFPNPARGAVNLEYELPFASQVELSVFDVGGRRVESLVGGPQSAGPHAITWRAADRPAGVYFVRLQAGKETSTRKVVLLR